MFLFKKVADLQQYLQKVSKEKKTIGFVPTMGALHHGHLSLVNHANSQTDCTVVSIFVNPTQFNDKKDLEKYPRTLGTDIEMLSSVQTTVLFVPSVEEIYPKGLDTTLDLDFGQLSTVLEGAFRPGHFDGMAQVVHRLLDIVKPDQLFMGQKDFQQLTIVRSMLEQLNHKTELVVCPIIREADGLAMSSRNRRLTPIYRKKAVLLSQILSKVKSNLDNRTPESMSKMAMKALTEAGFKPEYFEIVDGITLQPIKDFSDATFVIALTAAWAGDIRLIDNMILKEAQKAILA